MTYFTTFVTSHTPQPPQIITHFIGDVITHDFNDVTTRTHTRAPF